MIQPSCGTRCTCLSNLFYCQSQECTLDGATCYDWGDPHYITFDSYEYDFQGDCEYVLTQPCNDSSEFIITGANKFIEGRNVSVTTEVKIILQRSGLEIIIDREYIMINGKRQSLNGSHAIIHRSNGVEVLLTWTGVYVFLNISYPMAIFWNGYNVAEITLSSRWQGLLCGLCGNYNNDTTDDLMLPDGSLTSSVNEFGSSWMYTSTTSTCGVPGPTENCSGDIRIAAESRCSELTRGVFRACNSIVDPTRFIDGCKLDYCSCTDEERERCYCDSLATYVADCATAGVNIPNWRKFACRKHYDS